MDASLDPVVRRAFVSQGRTGVLLAELGATGGVEQRVQLLVASTSYADAAQLHEATPDRTLRAFS
jgi:hypothetical protein